MDIFIGIPGMTDDEMADRFMRGISDRRIRTHIRQVQADPIKESIHAAIAFDSAQLEEDGYQPQVYFDRRMSQEGGRQRVMEVENPMEIDAIEFRRRPNFQRNGNYGVYNERSRQHRSSNREFYGGRNANNPGRRMKQNLPLNTLDDQQPSSTLANTFTCNKLIDFDPYVTEPLNESKFPILIPTRICTTSAKPTSADNCPFELTPIIPEISEEEELKYISELNMVSTNLPVYQGVIKNRNVVILIDSGASENYVSPDIALLADQSTLVTGRLVETANGQTSKITHQVNFNLGLNGIRCPVQAYVFPTKFDVILGRSWLKMMSPEPDWLTVL
ncbi:hypothetical protein G6F43_012491 [Rhizopus delemar]|nr:hypothetical protein G6F43_012491 [Rhizopus delemar]